MSQTPNRRLFWYGVLATVFTIVAFDPLCLEAQTVLAHRKPRAATAKLQSSQSQNQKPQLLFNYYSGVLSQALKNPEYVFVAIAKDGSTQAVQYGPYNPAINAVYAGRLPKADVARLVTQAESVIPKASEINKPYASSCDSDQFQLSLTPQNGSATQFSMTEPACMLIMPEDILALVEEMRMIWKRLSETRPAYGYVRSFPLTGDFLKSPQLNAKHIVSIRKFPPELRSRIREASRQTPKFYGLNQAQYDRLKSLASDPSHFYVMHKGGGYSLTLFQSRKSGFQS